VLNVLAGGDELGAAMVSHPGTRMISFTGSVAAGKSIAEAAGRQMKQVVCELGGNDAAIVLDDVDVKAVAPRLYGAAWAQVPASRTGCRGLGALRTARRADVILMRRGQRVAVRRGGGFLRGAGGALASW
jgi:hypothetical protein